MEPTIDPDKGKKEKNELVISYLSLRKYLGILGIALPIILLIGSIFANDGVVEGAISDYFHTPLRQFFTISLGGISLLLFAYKGYDNVDKWITNIAGAFGLLTAFVFTSFKDHSNLHGYILTVKGERSNAVSLEDLAGKAYEIIPIPVSSLQSVLHLCFAALFFLLLGYMSIKQFTKLGNRKENWVYRICGWVIIATILLLTPIALNNDKITEFYHDYRLIFCGEFICLWAFGISWLVKGYSSHKDIN